MKHPTRDCCAGGRNETYQPVAPPDCYLALPHREPIPEQEDEAEPAAKSQRCGNAKRRGCADVHHDG